jgi:hypothetical protein
MIIRFGPNPPHFLLLLRFSSGQSKVRVSEKRTKHIREKTEAASSLSLEGAFATQMHATHARLQARDIWARTLCAFAAAAPTQALHGIQLNKLT